VLTFTCDEAYSFATARSEYADDSIHLQDWPSAPAEWTNPELEAEVAALLRVRTQVNEAIEPLRAAGRLGKSLDAAVTLSAAPDDPLAPLLEKHRDFLPELFIVSRVAVGSSSEATAPKAGTLHVAIQPCAELGHVRCPRCWRWVPALQATSHAEVCPRCAEALHS
jgi:isoleucyl-tRNA synthetase